MDGIASRLSAVKEKISDAAAAAGRDVSEITTIVVTKFHSADLVRELVALGIADFGENRHQEAMRKADELIGIDIRWHFIGQLQTNKARQVSRYAKVIHSIDRPALVSVLDSLEPQLDCFIQVDLGDQPGRGGVRPENLDVLVEQVLAAPGLRLQGLMTVAPLGEPPRPVFARLRKLSEQIQQNAPTAAKLSMGMSHDFVDAIAEGATHLRIGTAITGNRPSPG